LVERVGVEEVAARSGELGEHGLRRR
jgi:hypothetical protein